MTISNLPLQAYIWSSVLWYIDILHIYEQPQQLVIWNDGVDTRIPRFFSVCSTYFFIDRFVGSFYNISKMSHWCQGWLNHFYEFSFLPLRKIKNKGSVSGHTHGSIGPLLFLLSYLLSIYTLFLLLAYIYIFFLPKCEFHINMRKVCKDTKV